MKNLRGQTLWLQVNATCIDWQNGDPVYLAIFIDITDVTELREMQKRLTDQTIALKDALEAAEKANRAKSDFLRSFTYYVDESGTPLHPSVGRCNHESSCGYHYTPKEYFHDHHEGGVVDDEIFDAAPCDFLRRASVQCL